MTAATIARMERYDDAGMAQRARELNSAVTEAEQRLAGLYRERAKEALKQYKQRHPMQVIATRFGVSRQTVHGWIKSAEVKE